MKNIVAIVAGLSLIIFTGVHFFSGFRSAFEADQACHEDITNAYNEEINTGCDHDLETRQWILYQKLDEKVAAKVIKRYRY